MKQNFNPYPGTSENAGGGIRGKPVPTEEPAAGQSRRAFLNQSLLYLVGLTSLVKWVKAQAVPPTAAVFKRNPVSPPGSQSIAHFTPTCTACHLCVSACPTQVLQPAWLEYGWSGILQPRMDYHSSFCNFECTLCGQVCPTGALLPLSKATKQTTQLGIATFLQERCIVYTDHTACGACAEHCPTQAVQMVPYRKNLTIPAVRETLCIGCGACEYACPVRPRRAIYVSGHVVHLAAQSPEARPLKVDIGKDFPF